MQAKLIRIISWKLLEKAEAQTTKQKHPRRQLFQRGPLPTQILTRFLGSEGEGSRCLREMKLCREPHESRRGLPVSLSSTILALTGLESGRMPQDRGCTVTWEGGSSPSFPGDWGFVQPCPAAHCTPAPHRASAECSGAHSAPLAWPLWTGPSRYCFAGCSTS